MRALSTKSYFQLSTALPLALPLLLPLVWVSLNVETRPKWLGDLTAFLWGSLIVGGIPYVAVALVFLWATRRRAERFFVLFSWVGPVVFALVMLAWGVLGLQDSLSAMHSVHGAIYVGTICAALSLAFGYAYVIIVHLLLIALGRVGAVRAAA